MSIPAAATGILAWRWALEGKAIKGVLRLHILLACAAVIGVWATVWLRSRGRPGANGAIPFALLLVETGVCVVVSLTAHLGGFLSGVNSGS